MWRLAFGIYLSYTFSLTRLPGIKSWLFSLPSIMAFKKREYNFYKKLCKQTISHIPNAAIYGGDPIFPPQILLNMLPDFIEEENFEACKAIEDIIREWFTDHGQEIPAGATLKIPVIK